MSGRVCPECQEDEFETYDDITMCLSCGHELPMTTSKYAHYKVGELTAVQALTPKLTLVHVHLGDDTPLPVITNAGKYLAIGDRVVVATIGAIVPAGADPDDAATICVQKTSLHNKASYGMLCDAPMLDQRGPKNKIFKVDDRYDIGDEPTFS